MSEPDHDLRDALRALRGDTGAQTPEAVAARVLAALPAGPPPDLDATESPAPPPAPRSPLAPLLFGTLLGIALGFGAARSLAPSPTPPAVAPRPESRPLRSGPEVLAVIGSLDSYGTRKNLDHLKRHDTFDLGAWLQCGPGSRAAVRIGPGIEVHLDSNAGFRVDSPTSLFAKEGRFYVAVDAEREVVVKGGHDAEVVARDAEFVLVANSFGVTVTSLRGVVRLTVGKGQEAAKPGDSCSFDLKAGLRGPRPNLDLDELVGWQARCLLEVRR